MWLIVLLSMWKLSCSHSEQVAAFVSRVILKILSVCWFREVPHWVTRFVPLKNKSLKGS